MSLNLIKKKKLSPTIKTTATYVLAQNIKWISISTSVPHPARSFENHPFEPQSSSPTSQRPERRLPLENPLNPASSRLAAIDGCIWRVRTVIRVRSGCRTMGGAWGAGTMWWHDILARHKGPESPNKGRQRWRPIWRLCRTVGASGWRRRGMDSGVRRG